MDLLDFVDIDHLESDRRQLQLSEGVFNEISDVDYLLISSRSRNYDPVQGGWVEELFRAGISVKDLERDCALDLRPELPCWISKAMDQEHAARFKRLVVFEPVDPAAQAPVEVWKVFQALRVFAGENEGIDAAVRVATPVLSTGQGKANFSVMLRMMFFAAASLSAKGRWGEINIIVSAASSDWAKTQFAAHKVVYLSPPEAPEEIQALVAPIRAQYKASGLRQASAQDLGLTERQIAAVTAYTGDSYQYMNRALRANNVEDPEFVQMQPLMEALSSGLARLKNHPTTPGVARYVKTFEGIEYIYKVSSVVREAAYTSTSWKPVFTLPTPGYYRFVIKCMIGKNIEDMSVYPEEAEVLFDSAMFHLVSELKVSYPELPEPAFEVESHELLPNTSNIHFSHL